MTESTRRQRPPRWVSLLQAVVFLEGLAMLVSGLAWIHPLADLATHFPVQHLMASAVLLALMSIARQWRWSVVCLFLLVVSAAQVVPWWVPAAGRGGVDQTSLRVFHFNVLTNNQRSVEVVSEIRAIAPDVIVLQEVDERWITGLHPLAAEYPYRVAAPRADNFGMIVLSRYRLTDTRTLMLGPNNIPSIEATMTRGDATVTLLATHPVPPMSPANSRSRNQQLLAVADHLAACPHPVVLVGDLNASMWSGPYRDLVGRTGLINTREGVGILPTWPTSLPALCRIPIDHCLVSPSIEVRAMRLGPDLGSDHLPIIVDLGLPSASDDQPALEQ